MCCGGDFVTLHTFKLTYTRPNWPGVEGPVRCIPSGITLIHVTIGRPGGTICSKVYDDPTHLKEPSMSKWGGVIHYGYREAPIS